MTIVIVLVTAKRMITVLTERFVIGDAKHRRNLEVVQLSVKKHVLAYGIGLRCFGQALKPRADLHAVRWNVC